MVGIPGWESRGSSPGRREDKTQRPFVEITEIISIQSLAPEGDALCEVPGIQ